MQYLNIEFRRNRNIVLLKIVFASWKPYCQAVAWKQSGWPLCWAENRAQSWNSQHRDAWVCLCMSCRSEVLRTKYNWHEIWIYDDLKQGLKMSACKYGRNGQVALGNQNNHFNQVSRMNLSPSGMEGFSVTLSTVFLSSAKAKLITVLCCCYVPLDVINISVHVCS